jgi:hypothetical protein
MPRLSSFTSNKFYGFALSGGVISPVVQYLIVAGGGAGGSGFGGGGGAGGFLESTFNYVSGTTYNITVGPGGTFSETAFHNGSNSSIIGAAININAIGGGGGAISGTNAAYGPAQTGGSGGGGSGSGSNFNGGFGTGGQGFAGASTTLNTNGGGGGGAGAVGTKPNGGIGKTTTIISSALATSANVGQVSGGSVYFAGGGGGHVGGLGGLGGGKDAYGIGFNIATNNRGGGGSPEGPGGSGVVIIKITSGVLITSTTGTVVLDTSGGYKTYIFKTSGTITFS